MLRQCLNVDNVFRIARNRTKHQLQAVDGKIEKQVHDLFYHRKYDLHSLHQEKKADDKRDLDLLLNMTIGEKDDNSYVMEELKRICLQYNINNPVIGDELYNPTKYDGTKVFYPYS